MKHLVNLIRILFVLLGLTFFFSRRVDGFAQTYDWSKPFYIFITPEDNADRNPIVYPRIIVDSTNRVHVFWAYKDPESNNSADYIMYSRSENGSWSAPVEIIPPYHSRGVYPYEVVLDNSGYFHIVWYGRKTGTDAYLYYSSSYVDNADSAKNWTAPRELVYYGGAALTFPIAFSIDLENILHLVSISGDTNPDSFFYIQSQDSGNNWSKPVYFPGSVIYGTEFYAPKIAVDNKQIIHVVWSSEAAPGETYDGKRAIYYCQSSDYGASWSAPTQLAVDFALYLNDVNIAIDGKGIVHVVINSSGANAQRFHRYSKDGGLSWSPMESIYAGSGRSGPAALPIDSSGRMHLISAANGPGGLLNTFVYTWWNGNEWAHLTNLGVEMGIIGESPAAAIGPDQVLHVLWWPYDRIGYLYHQLDSPIQPTRPINTISPAIGIETMVPSISTSMPKSLEQSKKATPTPISFSSSTQISQSMVLFISIVPVIFLLILVFTLSRVRIH